jgi:hypothetical protein
VVFSTVGDTWEESGMKSPMEVSGVNIRLAVALYGCRRIRPLPVLW